MALPEPNAKAGDNENTRYSACAIPSVLLCFVSWCCVKGFCEQMICLQLICISTAPLELQDISVQKPTAIVLHVMIAKLASVQTSYMLQWLLNFHPACQQNPVSCLILHLHASVHLSACGLPHAACAVACSANLPKQCWQSGHVTWQSLNACITGCVLRWLLHAYCIHWYIRDAWDRLLWRDKTSLTFT